LCPRSRELEGVQSELEETLKMSDAKDQELEKVGLATILLPVMTK
jgi:hypothetical protein